METDKVALILAFFGLLAFLAFLSTKTSTTTASTVGVPYLLIEKNEEGRILSVKPIA